MSTTSASVLEGLLPTLPDYVELHAISNFTFLTGASHPGELIERAFALGYRGIALTDECSVAGTARAHQALKELREETREAAEQGPSAQDDPQRHAWLQAVSDAAAGFSLLIGSRVTLTPRDDTDDIDDIDDIDDTAAAGHANHADKADPPGHQASLAIQPRERADLLGPLGTGAMRLVLLARNREGFGNLSELITLGRRRVAKGSYLLHPDDLADPRGEQAHLRGLPDCLVVLLPDYCAEPDVLLAQAAWCRTVFGERVWLGLEMLQGHADALHRGRVEAVSAETGVPLVAAGAVTMHVRSRKPLADVLTAIRLGRPLRECGMALAPNAESHLRMRQRLSRLYPRDAMAQTLRIAAACDFSLGTLRYEYPEELVPPGKTPIGYLRSETMKGAAQRYPGGIPESVLERLEQEFLLIEEKQYEPFFLTVHDIVRFARGRQILCQGRGSAANSVVCYCLYITEVSPEQTNLLFGRFISRERDEPPDIDVDFEHQRREEVIQYIYEKYGRHRAALAASLISYRARSALRDVGRALGIDPTVVEQVVKGQAWWDGGNSFLDRIARYGLDPESPTVRQWASLTEQIKGFPRHLSQHVGGFVIARHKLSRLVPIENAAMENRSVIQWDKDDLESLGLLKVDVLALGMLTAIRRALAMIPLDPGQPEIGHRMEDIPADDRDTYAMLCKADSVGVFQVESRAQQSMLPRLLPTSYYDLVVQVAIVRPGPIQGGMVHPYLKRREALRRTGKQPIYHDEVIRNVLGRTLGVPIFQEQVMQLAIDAAGFTPGQADQLRRSMAAWRRRGDLRKHQDALMAALAGNGYPEAFALAICKQIEGFGEYGFPESHAASFAKLVYISAWIKCHHPAAFLCALLNSLPMGFYSASQLVQDAARHGVRTQPVAITRSGWESALEPVAGQAQPDVRLGFGRVNGMREAAALRIERARAERPFASVDDLVQRARLDRHDIDVLAGADALESLAGHRRQARWQARAAALQAAHRDLLYDTSLAEDALVLPAPRLGEEVVADYDSLGLSLKSHPLTLLRSRLKAMKFVTAAQLARTGNGRRVRACGIVTVRQRPSTASGTIFTSIEDESGAINVIIWPDLVERQRKEVLGAKLLGVIGMWQRQGEVKHLVAEELIDLSPLLGRLATPSRDFH